MGWITNSTEATEIVVAHDVYTQLLREETIATGYYLTETDATTKEKTTKFVKTGSVIVRAKVNVDQTVTEYRGLTKATADAIIANNATNLEKVFDGHTFYSGSAWVDVASCVGTVYRATARRVNEANGWTVTITKTTQTAI